MSLEKEDGLKKLEEIVYAFPLVLNPTQESMYLPCLQVLQSPNDNFQE